MGPTESFPADECTHRQVHAYETDTPRGTGARELSPSQQLLVDALAEVLTELLKTVAREAIFPAFKEVVAPAVKRKWGGLAKSLRSTTREASGQAGTTRLATLAAAAPPADSYNEADAAVEEPKIVMSSAEFRRRLVAALAAEEFADRQKRMLSNARIEDEDIPPEFEGAIKLALEGNASLLDEGTRAAVMQFLAGARIADGEHLPPRQEEIKGALRLTAGS
ncbi:hypothetical protein ACFYTG_28975 [Streptomyces mirabilis]|uniref:hypothetical protein n=1 Tax=Streptomyces mirabilis TaxID=68239 RepID=UPI00368FF621